MAISYKLEKFEGPLDLLLHLIEKNKVDIYDIPIVEITKQYLDYVNQMEKEDLKGFYPEFRKWEPYCRFQGCNHISEPDCGVRQGLEEGSISLLRYENYKLLYEELKAVRKY